MYSPLGQDKDFCAAVCEQEIDLPKWDYMKIGQISERIEKIELATELQHVLSDLGKDSNGRLVVNNKNKLAEVSWYENMLYTLAPGHRFFNRNYTHGKPHPGFYEASPGEPTVADVDAIYWNIPKQAKAVRTSMYKKKLEVEREERKADDDRWE